MVRFGLILDADSRCIGWTAWAGRRAVGLGGVVIKQGERSWGHFGATDDYREYILRGLHRRTVKLLRRLQKAGAGEIFATCDIDIPKAEAWMKRLRFEPLDETVNGLSVHVRRA